MRHLILVPLLLLIAGCPSNPVIETKNVEVKIPVPVKCKITPPEKPESLLGRIKMDDDIHTMVKIILAEIESRKAYEKKLEAATKECQ